MTAIHLDIQRYIDRAASEAVARFAESPHNSASPWLVEPGVEK